ncbi:hypothetical protein COB57_06300 [Candidatus Peregrinibacteria bacterium]|nr:MAG: hypothetical protein COB57_06300 [Candidatus Peregrinibacteria bacterium]
MLGKTIQIYLTDGNPRGIRVADITSRTIQALLIPRSHLKEGLSRPEIEGVGIYLLFGETESSTKPLVYIGEAEDCKKRISQHNLSTSKINWNTALVITSKTLYFTKSHVKYLENYCYTSALNSGRFQLQNISTPTKSYIPDPVVADLMDIFETMKILVSTLGFPVFDIMSKKKTKHTLICEGKGAKAFGNYTEDGLTVLKKSSANLLVTPSASPWISNYRKSLLDGEIIFIKDGFYEFKEDYIFESVSRASSVILGRNSNGWSQWKYENGRTLDEVIRQDIS